MTKALACVLLVGLALRLGMAFSARRTLLILDEANYADIAQNLAARGEFAEEAGRPTALRTPLYPAFLSVFVRLGSGAWSYARTAQALLDTTTILLLYVFSLLTLKNEREAFAGALLYALHPVFIAYSSLILTETLFLWLWVLALVLLLKAAEAFSPRNKSTLVAAGIVLGLPTLCRPNALLFPAVCLGILMWVHRHHEGLLRRLSLIFALSYLALIPWMVRNRFVMGSWAIATQGGSALWVGAQVPFPSDSAMRAIELQVKTGRTDFEAEAEFYRLGKLAYSQNALIILKDLPHRFFHFWLTSHSAVFGVDKPISEYRAQGRWMPIMIRTALWGLHLALLLLGGWGLWSARKAWTMGCTIAVVAVAYYSQHIFLTYWGNRYHLPALILLVPFAGSAIVRGLDSIRPAPLVRIS